MENHQTEPQKETKSDKHQTRVLIAVALIILGIVFILIALNQPRVNSETSVHKTVKTSMVDETTTKHKNKTTVKKKSSSEHKTSSKTSKVSTTKKAVSFPINLNTCTAEDLMEIDTVGETRANAIIAYREHLGGYTSVEQLKNISGIGDNVFASIAPYVTV
ncbi:MAG: helix-hairpin-helix domain-containing protein [Eubacterium sp.]|nr:helix-hairpin-helix domain-containing protein [Eubacterium sp.]